MKVTKEQLVGLLERRGFEMASSMARKPLLARVRKEAENFGDLDSDQIDLLTHEDKNIIDALLEGEELEVEGETPPAAKKAGKKTAAAKAVVVEPEPSWQEPPKVAEELVWPVKKTGKKKPKTMIDQDTGESVAVNTEVVPEKPVKKAAGKKGAVAKAKGKGEVSVKTESSSSKRPNNTSNFKRAGGSDKPGIVQTIINLLTKAGREGKTISRERILKTLVKRFPDRSESSMKVTVWDRVPRRLLERNKITVRGDKDRGFWIEPEVAAPE